MPNTSTITSAAPPSRWPRDDRRGRSARWVAVTRAAQSSAVVTSPIVSDLSTAGVSATANSVCRSDAT